MELSPACGVGKETWGAMSLATETESVVTFTASGARSALFTRSRRRHYCCAQNPDIVHRTCIEPPSSPGELVPGRHRERGERLRPGRREGGRSAGSWPDEPRGEQELRWRRVRAGRRGRPASPTVLPAAGLSWTRPEPPWLQHPGPLGPEWRLTPRQPDLP